MQTENRGRGVDLYTYSRPGIIAAVRKKLLAETDSDNETAELGIDRRCRRLASEVTSTRYTVRCQVVNSQITRRQSMQPRDRGVDS